MSDIELVPTLTDLIPEPPIPSASGTTRDATDGRVALRLRNRQRVVNALVELVEEGNISPSMDEIVERSGASERSIFRYFNDLSDLSMSAIRTVVERVDPLRIIPDQGQGTLEHRIDQMIASRLRVAQQTHGFATLARRKLAVVPEIQEGLGRLLAVIRVQLSDQFAIELGAMDDERAVGVLDTLVMLFSFEGYDVLGRQLANDADVVAQRWRMVMLALLS